MFKENGIHAINLISSPGAGKTSILEKAIPILRAQLQLAVIEGDVMTTLDAERIAALGMKTVQINTRGACHLDAKMIHEALLQLPLSEIDLLFIENVGNLVCPADFDLGEQERIAILSVTEGVDKVEKYPFVFQHADAVLLNKMDLLPYLDFDLSRFDAEIQKLNPIASVYRMSATNGEGVRLWCEHLIKKLNVNHPESE